MTRIIPQKLPVTAASDLIKEITQKELDLAYTTCGVSTAPGPSGMRYSQWIRGPENFQRLTLELFNHVINTGTFPSGAKAGIILPIPKNPLEPCTPENARPLTMLETGLKLFNTIIANRIKASLNKHPIFFPIQDAFLPNRNIDDSLHILNEVISDANRFDKELHIVYLDLKQAFDRAEFWMSNIALEKLGFPEKIIKVVSNITENASRAVLTEDGLTDEWSLECGVPVTRGPEPVKVCCNNGHFSDMACKESERCKPGKRDIWIFTSRYAQEGGIIISNGQHLDSFGLLRFQ